MKNLFIDDVRSAPNESWHVVRTITEAIRCIHTQDWDNISLDHDSGSAFMGESEEGNPICVPETFEPVARFLCVQQEAAHGNSNVHTKIFVHSGNPCGADNMVKIIGTAKRITLKELMEIK